MQPRHAMLPIVTLLAAFGGTASAQTQPSPEQAQALESQITDWLKTTTAGALAIPTRPVQLTPEGDHYLVRVPLGAFGKVDPADAAFTAKARMLDGTRWALDDERFPDALAFTTTEMVPDAADSKNPNPDGKHPETATYHIRWGQQDVHGVFDPTNSQPTTNGGTVASLDVDKAGGASGSTSHMDRFTYQTSSQPTDATHLNLLEDGTAEGYATHTELADGTTVKLNAKTMHVVAAISGLAHDRLVPLIHAAAALGQMAKSAGSDGSDGPTPAQRAQMHTLLETARDALTGARLDESMEGVTFDFDGSSGSLAKAGVSFGGDAPGASLSAQIALELDGLQLNGLPPALAAYVPTHFAIRPTMSNVDLAVLTKMGLDATSPPLDGQPAAPNPPNPNLMFAHGGIDVGFDGLALDVAGAKLSGAGKFTVTKPNAVTGQAELTATGLDALITRLQADPAMAQAIPVVIFLKGIAHSSADRSVWQITVNNTTILVNGVDLSAMAGAMK